MKFHAGSAPALVAAAIILTGTAVHVQAGELGFFEMLFGARPAVQPVQAPREPRVSYRRPKVAAVRHRLRTQYAALPVKIRASHLQTPLDMKKGVAAALLKDETLRPGDIVVFDTGARVFTGDSYTQHTMSEFEPVQHSSYVSRPTRKLLAGMMTPIGGLPADEARRVVARARKAAVAEVPMTTQATAMRVINPWQTNP